MATARLRFTVDKRAIASLAREPEVKPFVEQLARKIAASTRANAPYHSGHYWESISATPARMGPDGWTAAVITTDHFWHLIEFGSVNNQPYRPMTRAAALHATFVDALRPA